MPRDIPEHPEGPSPEKSKRVWGGLLRSLGVLNARCANFEPFHPFCGAETLHKGHYRFAACAAVAGYPFEVPARSASSVIIWTSCFGSIFCLWQPWDVVSIHYGTCRATWHSIGFIGHYLDQFRQMRPLPCTLRFAPFLSRSSWDVADVVLRFSRTLRIWILAVSVA